MKLFKNTSKKLYDSYSMISNIRHFNPTKDTSIKIKDEIIYFDIIPNKTKHNDFIIYTARLSAFLPLFFLKMLKLSGVITLTYFGYQYLKTLKPDNSFLPTFFLLCGGYTIIYSIRKSHIKITKVVKSIILRKDFNSLEIKFFMNKAKNSSFDKVYINTSILKYINPNYKDNFMYWRINDEDHILIIDNFETLDPNILFSVLHGYKIQFNKEEEINKNINNL